MFPNVVQDNLRVQAWAQQSTVKPVTEALSILLLLWKAVDYDQAELRSRSSHPDMLRIHLLLDF